MKYILFIFTCILCSTLSYADLREEQKIKQVAQELIQMSPLVQTCVLILEKEVPVKNRANYIRMIQDFDDLLDEMCRMQDNLHQEKNKTVYSPNGK